VKERIGFNHLGHTVADIASARRFYEGVLGFKFWWDLEVPDEFASRVLMVPPPVDTKGTLLNWKPRRRIRGSQVA
jgi:catechol 2,3-dioxygenase-like lactoylglutathione lyase family enzyme